MNRVAGVQVPIRECFPRVSGDEPDLLDWGFCMVQFSPRERG